MAFLCNEQQEQKEYYFLSNNNVKYTTIHIAAYALSYRQESMEFIHFTCVLDSAKVKVEKKEI